MCKLPLGSEESAGFTLEADALRLNHFTGFDRNWVSPEEGDAERDATGEPGDRESCVLDGLP